MFYFLFLDAVVINSIYEKDLSSILIERVSKTVDNTQLKL